MAIDKKALFNISYGLYVITTNDGKKDNGFICNSVMQITDDPLTVLVSVRKVNYSCETIKNTGKLTVNCLSTEAPFKVFRHFGFQSGRNVDKFEECGATAPRTVNGLIYLPKYINSYMALEVVHTVDFSTHMVFICKVAEAVKVSEVSSMTYTYYQENVKPKPAPQKGWICKVCGYVYEGDELPEDFICPLCKHPASDFEKIGG